jgi:hypothetical protein
LNICHEIHVKHCCILLVACYVNITMAIISRFCWISIDKLMLQVPYCCFKPVISRTSLWYACFGCWSILLNDDNVSLPCWMLLLFVEWTLPLPC